jgi:hypothetical protein
VSGLRWALIEVMPFSLKDQTYIFINTNAGFCSTGLPLSSRWAPVLRPKTSKTFVQTSKFFSFYLDIYIKINSRIWFGPVNSIFLFEDCLPWYLIYKNVYWLTEYFLSHNIKKNWKFVNTVLWSTFSTLLLCVKIKESCCKILHIVLIFFII